MFRKLIDKRKIIPSVIILLFIFQIASVHFSTVKNSSAVASFAIMNTFPVDIDLLFWQDDPNALAAKLNAIGNCSNGWIMSPWGGHFVSNHIEGADKWYLYCGRNLEVYAPADGDFCDNINVGNGTVDNIGGHDVVVDVAISIDLGQSCIVQFGHINLLESIYNQITSNNNYHFTEGEVIGVTPNPWAMDFYYYTGSNRESISPYAALSTSLQAQIDYYYGLQYERAKISGLHPEGKMSNPFDINLAESIWGTWQYRTGPYDIQFAAMAWPGESQFGFITLLNRSLTTEETFFRNPLDPENKNLTDIDLGIFGDGNGPAIPEYSKIGQSLVRLVEGTKTDGILSIITIEYQAWGQNTTIYTRVFLEENNTGYTDDILSIEYFTTLEDAQAGFTSDRIIYERFIPYWSRTNDNTNFFGINAWLIVFGFVFPIIAFAHQRRK
ncbi:MAG: hypothetical protein ACFFDW_01520 [Candidatus Thorarchaeota archaeon]